MSSVSSGGGHGGGSGLDFELNLASIIDCFTVLIAFMLASASFLSVGLLDAGVAAAGSTSTGAPPSVQLQLEMKLDHTIVMNLTGKSQLKRTIASKDGNWDYAKLQEELGGLSKQWPDLKGAILSGENKVEYKDIITAMDTTRKTLPAVMLGGF